MSQATLSPDPYLNSNLFSGYYLDERVDDLDYWDCDEEAQEAFNKLQVLWETEGDLVAGHNEDELIDSWIDEVLDVLGFGTLSETSLPNSGGYTDRLLFESEEGRRDAALRKEDGDLEATFNLSSAVLEAKQWDYDFSKRFSEQRSYRDASHQIKYYLEHTPERLQWGILTDGKKWRLYGTKDYATETYYEIDLPEILESGDLDAFKYFYVFFRPEAFRETSGTSFLDTVWNESETAAQELGEDLQDNVFTALRILGEGFVETNDLDIDPADEKARAELKEQSLVLLYRLMFVLYAESRHLIHPDDPTAEDDYQANFSLDQLRQDIHGDIQAGDSFEDYSEHSTSMWSRLQDLFRLVDTGEESLGIPPYNGGLFDDDSHGFLADNQVSNRYISEVIYRLGTTQSEDGSFVLADYADLDTRHLGTIYEGLLEHEFRIAPEQYAAVSDDGGQVWKPATEVSVADAVETVETGELYVVNDDGERKATGAYYTPDYVVAYIVEETIDPLISDIDDDLREDGLEPSDREYFAQFWQRILNLKVLDPAMGSGHFLTKATGYLTERVMEVVREQEIQSYDEQDLRREIAKECIYGVDLNGMAVELAKLSMWLETLATDQPLAFLDHHLKAGNSLVGSNIMEVLADDTVENGGQLTLLQAFARVRQRTLEHVMDLMKDLLSIDNESLEEIKSMEEIYAEIRADPLYQRLFELANVHTAEQFGVDVDEDAYEIMAQAIEDEDDWSEIRGKDWFRSAQKIAKEEDFFHWELEFPEVFFSEEGEQMEQAGFDAVVGNPPYVRIQRIHQELTQYLFSEYDSCASRTDLSLPFIEAAINLLNDTGYAAYISTSQWISTDYGRTARDYLSAGRIRKILDFNTLPVFEGVSTYPAIFVMAKKCKDTLSYAEVTEEADLTLDSVRKQEFRDISYSQLDEDSWVLDKLDLRATLDTRTQTTPLSELGHFHIGAITGLDDVFVVDEETIQEKNLEEELIFPYAHQNQEIQRFATVDPEHYLIYPYRSENGDSILLEESRLNQEYPNIHKHLSEHHDELTERKDSRKFYAQGPDWYQFLRPGRFDYVEAQKLLFRGLATRTCVGWLKERTVFSGNNCPGFISDTDEYSDEYLLALLNSKLLSEYLVQLSPAKMQGYSRFNAGDLNEAPVRSVDFDVDINVEQKSESAYQLYKESILEPVEPEEFTEISEAVNCEPPAVAHEFITFIVPEVTQLVDKLSDLNLSILDHLGGYSDGSTLSEIGLTQPPKDSAESILQETSDDRPNLRIGKASVVRETLNTVEIRLTARYKPDEEDNHETDQWGYTETDLLPALRITDLTEVEADLIEEFLPKAVDEAGGFANFRATATKTNSLVDRLRSLTLPVVDEVSDGLQSYIDTKDRAEELEKKIDCTEHLIDLVIYELYGLTDEEISIVEDSSDE
ncbi:Eco57I restriction-modification methylase domain-containing protein [Halorussus halophilus]|uniref:Eco57I restriction-modification methylase domain-containing protein n=1 Tax=Halorussus halophilus TaxID=2650975 RepID=UPI0013019086|nr:DNA methyltransferase [Halorussus halophilus]